MGLTPVFLDYETYWDQTFSLSKLSAIEYVTDPQFEVQSVALQIGLDGPVEVLFGYDAIASRYAQIDWDRAFAIGHNMAEFDALIHAWVFGINPRLWGCTLAMARPHHARDVGGSLKALAKHYQLPDKGSLEATNTKGKRLADFTESELDAMRVYNVRDTELCAELFKRLAPLTPKPELRLIDTTIRMLTEPRFELDVARLEKTLAAERRRKAKAMLDLSSQIDDLIGADVLKTLSSTAKFASLLEALGETVPTKVSATTGKTIPALAKTDEGLQTLLDSPNDLVRAAAEARLDAKSTILETRLQRFIDIAARCDNQLPIALRYYGANTGRWSGIMGLNQQNLPRVDPKNLQLSHMLRLSMRAPRGKRVVVADLSGIELRVNHFLWRVDSSMDAYAKDPKADLYRLFAASMFQKDPDDVTKAERQLAKVCQLGLGYGAGAATFQRIARNMGGITLTEDEARKAVTTWRSTYPEIVAGWKTCDNALIRLRDGFKTYLDPWGMVCTDKHALITPRGRITYPDLRQKQIDGDWQWRYGSGRNERGIYGALVDENIVQHLARHVMTDALLAWQQTDLGQKYPLAHMVHDELVFVVDAADADAVLAGVLEHFSTPPVWWPQLITYAEGDIALSYGAAK